AIPWAASTREFMQIEEPVSPPESQSLSAQSRVELRLSYRFQSLREKLRQAVVNGELEGKLPGERQLARRFHVNAKTLSKALTDLAAEGLLQRSIGRGTFVKTRGDGAATASDVPGRWLIVCDQEQAGCAIIAHLRQSNPSCQLVHDTKPLRPSFLST